MFFYKYEKAKWKTTDELNGNQKLRCQAMPLGECSAEDTVTYKVLGRYK